MAEKNTDKCKHPGCNCAVPKGKTYCSESVGDRLSIACECGHTACATGETVGAAE
jgi:hypothetical protein